MNPDEPEADETTPEEEEWQLYATAGYAAAEDPWDDLVEVEDDEDEAVYMNAEIKDDYEDASKTSNIQVSLGLVVDNQNPKKNSKYESSF